MVLGHYGPFIESFKTIQELIYIFHIPLFFMISATNVYGNRDRIVRSIRKIFIVYFVCVIYTSRGDFSRFFDCLVFGNFDHLRNILWFLPALISFQFLLLIIENSTIKKILLTASLILGINPVILNNYGGFVPWGFLGSLYLLFPIFMAIKISKIDFDNNIFSSKKILFTVLFFAISVIYFVQPIGGGAQFPHKIDVAQNNLPTLAAYPFFIVMFLSSSLLANLKFSSTFLANIGNASLPIYLLHVQIINFLDIFKNALLQHIALFLIISYIVPLLYLNYKKLMTRKSRA